MEPTDISNTGADIYSVTRLNREVRAVLEGSFRTLWVKGEISNLAVPASGHMYFSLKDEYSQVRCAMFKNRNRLLKFKPESGDEILVQANVSLYEGRGEFQLIVQSMEPAGLGALQKAFEQLKEKLAGEGLFDEQHKKPVPEYPGTIGVITSPTGAAVRDILTTLKRRYPMAEVIVYPVPVQGASAAGEITTMIATANNRSEVDVLILARGGGSLEDLWSFNEEVVARAVFDSAIPIITGIGHEIDFTIADFVADRRAATPSSAAEVCCLNGEDVRAGVTRCLMHLNTSIRVALREYQQRLDYYQGRIVSPARRITDYKQSCDRLLKDLVNRENRLLMQKAGDLNATRQLLYLLEPRNVIRANREKISVLFTRAGHLMRQAIDTKQEKIRHVCHALELVSPLAVLGRGYTITRDTRDGSIIRDTSGLEPGNGIKTVLKTGYIISEIKETSG